MLKERLSAIRIYSPWRRLLGSCCVNLYESPCKYSRLL